MLIPCIDLQRGQAVQLVHGRKRELAVQDLFGLLDSFRAYSWIHIVDLDRALGAGNNDRLARKLCFRARTEFKMKVRIGGGIRTEARARRVLGWDPAQIMIGSAAFRDGAVNTGFLKSLKRSVKPERIILALDTERGRIVTHGWRKRLALRAERVMAELEPFCAGFLCTDVDREGTLAGANLHWFESLRRATSLPLIAAGGIRTPAEVAALEKMGIDGAVGMALYKGLF